MTEHKQRFDRIYVEVERNWMLEPRNVDTLWIASQKPLPFYEAIWTNYLTTVRDLLRAGF